MLICPACCGRSTNWSTVQNRRARDPGRGMFRLTLRNQVLPCVTHVPPAAGSGRVLGRSTSLIARAYVLDLWAVRRLVPAELPAGQAVEVAGFLDKAWAAKQPLAVGIRRPQVITANCSGAVPWRAWAGWKRRFAVRAWPWCPPRGRSRCHGAAMSTRTRSPGSGPWCCAVTRTATGSPAWCI
jgi:hypothetical protein